MGDGAVGADDALLHGATEGGGYFTDLPGHRKPDRVRQSQTVEVVQESLGTAGGISPDEQTRVPLVSIDVIRKSCHCLVEDGDVVSCGVGAGIAGA